MWSVQKAHSNIVMLETRGTGREHDMDIKVPLYRQIADALIRDIQQGKYDVGEVMPSEVELAVQLKISRGSVREALQILADAGIVERARKLGTRVLRTQPQTAYVQRLNSLTDALGFGNETVMRIDDVRDVEQPDEPLLRDEISPTGFWLQITGIRHLPGDTSASTTWARTYVSGPFSGIRPLLTGEVASIYPLIEQAYGLRVTRLRHKITAIALPDYAASRLGLLAGVPALEVDAWLYSDTGALIEFVRSIHNPARFSMEFSTQSAG
jgi:GntR family transcriptional regulator